MLDRSEVPVWLSALLTEKFFNACITHEDAKNNEKNVFCLDCCEAVCPHCFIHHCSHRLLQIRRYMYQDVMRLVDADKLMECAQVQSYISNGAKVVFLNQRAQPQSRPFRSSGNFCVNCDRNLQESYLFCSLSCKLEHILGTGSKLSKYLRTCEFLALPEPGLDDGLMTPDTVLEPAGSMRSESCSSCGGSAGLTECQPITSTAMTIEFVRKKRTNRPGIRPVYGPGSVVVNSDVMMNRRKGTPNRSPLY